MVKCVVKFKSEQILLISEIQFGSWNFIDNRLGKPRGVVVETRRGRNRRSKPGSNPVGKIKSGAVRQARAEGRAPANLAGATMRSGAVGGVQAWPAN